MTETADDFQPKRGTVTKLVNQFLDDNPTATPEEVLAAFPTFNPSSVASAISRYRTGKKLELLQKIRDGDVSATDIATREDTIESIAQAPPLSHGGGNKLKEDGETDKPAPTGRVWRGEKWRLKEDGSIEWYMPRNPEVTYFNFYNTFILNEYNFPSPHPLGNCHREWGEKLERGSQKQAFLCSRDHLKTSFISIGYPIYDICQHKNNPNWTGILIIAWDRELALDNIDSIIANLENNPFILSFFGYLFDDDRRSTQMVRFFSFQPPGSKPGLKCVPFKTGKITGTHPHLAILDDIQDEALSPEMMRKFKVIIDRKLLPAVGRQSHGRVIITGTIKGWDASNDGYLWIQKKKTFDFHRYPAIIGPIPPISDCEWIVREKKLVINGKVARDVNGEPITQKTYEIRVKDREKYKTLFPERYTIEDIMAKYFELRDDGDDAVFYSEYLLIPSSPTGKYFPKKRIRPMREMPFTKYHDYNSFMDYVQQHRVNTYLWVDPGGQTRHGISMAVIARHNGVYFVLEIVSARKGILNAATVIAELLIAYNVRIWGVEGNWLQKEAFGYTLDREVRRILQHKGEMRYYHPPLIKSNKGDKIQRIREGMNAIIGLEGMPYTFFVNENAQGYSRFLKESSEFGIDIRPSQHHDFDVLDCIVSADHHILGVMGDPVCASR